MNHLTIFIVSGMLLLASGTKAETVNLYCELSKDKKSTITINSITSNLGNPISAIEVIIDTKKETILKAPRIGPPWAKNLHEEIWSSSLISWGTKPNSIDYLENYYLNRYTLKLKKEVNTAGALQESYYDCLKTKKKI